MGDAKSNNEEIRAFIDKFREHKFAIGFSFGEDLLPFAGVDYKNLKAVKDDGAAYRLLTAEDYLYVYKKSLKDSY